MSSGRISFICSLHNCLPFTQAMLQSLEDTVDLSEKQVVLIDDASTDGTAAFLASIADRPYLTLLSNPENLGYAAANNKAAAAATGDLLVFINNDLEFSGKWLEPMLRALESQPEAGAVGNVQRNFKTGLVDHAGIFFDLRGLPTHAHKNRAHPPAGQVVERNAVTAACLLVRRNTFQQAGGFDPAYRNGCEDVDFCMKLKSQGLRIYVALESVIRHHVSPAPGRRLHDAKNTEVFRQRWSAVAAEFGKGEWAREYFRRYARYWWRMDPTLALKAARMLVSQGFR